nr:MAG TPA: hypothetical protein [Caudoviricetes sp.]
MFLSNRRKRRRTRKFLCFLRSLRFLPPHLYVRCFTIFVVRPCPRFPPLFYY